MVVVSKVLLPGEVALPLALAPTDPIAIKTTGVVHQHAEEAASVAAAEEVMVVSMEVWTTATTLMIKAILRAIWAHTIIMKHRLVLKVPFTRTIMPLRLHRSPLALLRPHLIPVSLNMKVRLKLETEHNNFPET
jgi:hypothetical protein